MDFADKLTKMKKNTTLKQNPHNFIDSKCDVGASKNAAEHFPRSEIFTYAIYKIMGVRLFLI